MQSRIPRCKASCNRKEEGPPQHDSTISNVQDAFSSLMDSGDSPCSVQQSIAVSSSAESVEKRPASKLAPSRSGRDTHVKWAVNQFYDGTCQESLRASILDCAPVVTWIVALHSLV